MAGVIAFLDYDYGLDKIGPIEVYKLFGFLTIKQQHYFIHNVLLLKH